MKAYKNLPLDREKFKLAIEAKGVDIYKAAEMIGRSRKYLYNIYVGTSVLPLPTVKTIEGILGVPYEAYKPTEPETIRGGEQSAPNVRDMSQGDLYETICDAVTDAFRSVKAELQRVMYEAMRDALNGNTGGK